MTTTLTLEQLDHAADFSARVCARLVADGDLDAARSMAEQHRADLAAIDAWLDAAAQRVSEWEHESAARRAEAAQ